MRKMYNIFCKKRVGRGKDVYWVCLLWRSMERPKMTDKWWAYSFSRDNLCAPLGSLYHWNDRLWSQFQLDWCRSCTCVCVYVWVRVHLKVTDQWRMSKVTNSLKGTWLMHIFSPTIQELWWRPLGELMNCSCQANNIWSICLHDNRELKCTFVNPDLSVCLTEEKR